MIHLTAFVQQQASSARDEGSREPHEVSADAATYADAQRMILEQLADGWVVASFRVS